MAAQKHATLPAELSAPEKRETDRLLKLSGAEFDRAYMRYMVREHKADVKEFQHEATKASDPDVQSWAGKTLPTLQEHLRMAEDIDSNVNGAPTIK
jgi:putative membrane protein